MNTNKHFEKYYSKLRLEAIFKSAICGVSVGFGANLLAAIITFFTPAKGLWIPLGVFVGVSIAAAFLFYFKKYRPNDQKNARRIDRLGLEERLVTMVEFDGDDSYIARAQREDAKAVLAKVEKSSIKFVIPRTIVVPALCLSILASGMTTVNVLAAHGVIKGGDDIIEEYVEEKNTEYVTVTYEAADGGIIEGDELQVIVKGTDATPVTAVADEGFMFKEWSDGNTNPTRFDKAVEEEITFEAIFIELEDPQDGEGGEDGDGPKGEPSDEQKDGEGNDGEGSNQAPMGGGSNKPDGSDNINDGQTDFRGELPGAQDNANSRGENGDFDGNEGDIVGGYMGIL